MSDGVLDLRYAFNVEAVRRRTLGAVVSELSEADLRVERAERALEEAERARREAVQARQQLEEALADVTTELADLTSERDSLLRDKEILWKEKKAAENEAAVLMKRIGELVKQLSAATSKDLQLELGLELQVLQRRLDDRNRSLYGTSSERRGRPEAEKTEPDPAPRRRKRTGSTRTRQPRLPIVKKEHRLPPEQCTGGCAACHGDLDEMKGQTEVTEEITVKRIIYEMVEHVCVKYRCKDCGWITTAPGPQRLIPGGRYSVEFAAHVAVNKFVDHLPLERQVRRMARSGLVVTSQTLWDQLSYLGRVLMPTVLALHALILTAAVCFADETSWRQMTANGSKRWWVWLISNGALVYFQIVPSRGEAAARELLQDFAGVLMADDYVVYRSLQRERTRLGGVRQVIDEDGNLVDLATPDFLLASCWMHARRYLLKAEQYHPETGPALDLIAGMYKAEAQAAEEADQQQAAAAAGTPMTDEAAYQCLLQARKKHRDQISRGLVERLDAWRKKVLRLPGSALAEALNHIDRIWPRLVLYLADPRIPIDNGHSERQHRDVVLGRNNYQGTRSAQGAQVAAGLYSLVRSTINLGLDPEAYLAEAARRATARPGTVFLPTDYAEMLRAQVAAATVETPADDPVSPSP